MKHKIFKSFIKAVDEAAGTIERIVSVFDNVDYVKDRVKPGAFKGTLERWIEKGDPIPVIFSHQWDNLDAHVGVVVDAKEVEAGDSLLPDEIKDNGGLYVKEKYDLDQPFALRLFNLQKDRRITESSFAYDVLKEQRQKDGVNDLLELDLIEVGPTLKGANPATQLLGAKAEKMTDDEIRKELGLKAYVAVTGSYEELQSELSRSVRGWAADFFGDNLYWSYIEATFDDRVIAFVELWDDNGTYYELSYERDESGALVFGEPLEVEVQGAVAPKHRGLKEGRRNSEKDSERIQSMHDLSVELGADCSDDSSSSSDDDDDTKRKTKGEEPSPANPEESDVRSAVAVLAEVEEIEADLDGALAS